MIVNDASALLRWKRRCFLAGTIYVEQLR